MVIIAQLTDMHVCADGDLLQQRVDTNACLERAVAKLLTLWPEPDVVLLTGDLSESGSAQSYAQLRRLIAPLRAPLYLIPGNHDQRDNLRAAFADHAYLPHEGEFLHYAIDAHRLRLIGLDTVVPGEDAGALCAQRLAWLEARLAEAPSVPTLIFMHHPPFACGIRFMDEIALAEPGAFGEIVQGHDQIQRIVCGHVHRTISTNFYGRTVVTCPSTAHQIALNLSADARAAFVMEPPGFLLHLWNGRSMITHGVSVGDYAGPHFYAPAPEG